MNIWNGEGDTRTGVNKGLAGLTQDQGDELNGRFTAIQGHTFNMMGSLNEIKIDMKAVYAQSAQALQHLAGIETNTYRLDSIETNIITMKNAIETISERGVKML